MLKIKSQYQQKLVRYRKQLRELAHFPCVYNLFALLVYEFDLKKRLITTAFNLVRFNLEQLRFNLKEIIA
ncbi:hypothetical protein BIX54_01180 [Mycoplasmoides pneumoniae]|nr:hypothetical protein C897_01180 [Mycoplasmoides pneumoniae PI 1428]ALA34317.1 hypothetical protein F537_01180 [Mycoplasmoides pneumoniae 85084]ALA36427.1 hypothetical protein F538_01160 [Mycoplasmoides pneumoniae M1139]ALA39242.1 hypothetical protein C680_01145 [Mycoplasmoides pneumoniae PO1]ALX06517.1 hypothetical protein AVK85_01110 [Mycoplasmoides pneumoniae]